MDVSVNKAEEKLLRLSADPETRREYELRAKALSDERSRLEDAKEEGFEEGVQKGIQEGIEKGIQKGIQKGIPMGIETGILDVVKKLLDSGISLEEAAKYTPFSADKLSKLLKNGKI